VEMSKIHKFWNDFIKDESLQKKPAFPMLLWQGISPSEARKHVWSRFQAPLSDPQTEVSAKAKDEILANLTLEVSHAQERGVAPPQLKDSDIVIVQRIILASAARNQREEYESGSAILVATLLSVVQDEMTAAALYEYILSQMERYRADEWKKMHTDVLVLADLMWQDLPQLAQHLNQCGFDVVDLRDISSNWMQGIFANLFSTVAVTRLLDIFLFEGPESLIGFTFGVFKVLMQQVIERDVEDLFRFISDIPYGLSERQIEDALRYGYEAIRVGAKRIAELRAEKDWPSSLGSAGPIRFAKGVGNTAVAFVREDSLRDIPAVAASPEEDSKGENKAESKLHVVVQTDVDDVLARLEKQRSATLDQNLRKLLEDAAKELQRLGTSTNGTMEREKHASVRSDRDHDSGDISSVESSISSAASGQDSEVPRDSEADGSSTDPVADLRARRKPPKKEMAIKGTVKYSKLFQYQQFPCLYMEGYLLKARRSSSFFKRNSSTGLFGNLHRRFFVLQGAFLTYFKSHRNNTPSKDLSVDMHGRTITRIDKHKFGKFGFEISEKDSDVCLYLLFASNADERNVWVQVLNAATESHN